MSAGRRPRVVPQWVTLHLYQTSVDPARVGLIWTPLCSVFPLPSRSLADGSVTVDWKPGSAPSTLSFIHKVTRAALRFGASLSVLTEMSCRDSDGSHTGSEDPCGEDTEPRPFLRPSGFSSDGFCTSMRRPMHPLLN